MNIKATIVEFEQGSEPWKQHRLHSLNASELGAAMGLSKYINRAELIQQKATGILPEVDAETQRRFDRGHAFEAAAREWAEEIIGEALYPTVLTATVDGLPLSASLDGQDLMGDVTWEHKSGAAALLASLDRNVIPDEYHPQMEQGLMLSGATRCLFMASNGTRESMRFCWYESNPELRAKIIPTWKQFMADVATYKPSAAEPIKPVGRTPDQLPALRASVTGTLVLDANIKEWEAAALVYIQEVRSHELKTDQDFEDADAAVKWCVSSKTTLDGLKSNLMSATGDVNTAVGTLDRLMSELDKTRIQFTKAMDARKAERKAEIVAGGVAAYEKHEADLIRDTGGPWIVLGKPDFGGAIKNLRTFTSIQNAVDTALAAAKIKADESARKIRESLRILADDGAGYEFLFNDRLALIGKAPDDLRLLVKSRISEHQTVEKEKEDARLKAESDAKAKAESDRLERERQATATPAPAQTPIQMLEQSAPVAAKLLDSSLAGFRATGTPAMRPMADQDWPNASTAEVITPTDNGARLTLTQLNAAIAPVSIDVAGLSSLGFEPVEKVKASRLYRACDLPAICAAMGRHLEAVAEGVAA